VRVKRYEHHNEIRVAGVCEVTYSDDWTTWRSLTETTDPTASVVVIDSAPGTRIYRARSASGLGLFVNMPTTEVD
jgi:hypothetical protein